MVEREPPFKITVDISSKSKNIRNIITIWSDKTWEDSNLEECIAQSLDVHPTNLRAQYILSTDKRDAIPISLTCEEDYNALVSRVNTLGHPGYTAAGKLSKRKRKDIIVLVTNKGDETASTVNDAVSLWCLQVSTFKNHYSLCRLETISQQVQQPSSR
jgi:hypothetical protein